MIPDFLCAALPDVARICNTPRWWEDIGVALDAFRELAVLNAHKVDTPEPWLTSNTVVRPGSPRQSGVFAVSPSTYIHSGVVVVGDVFICDDCEIGPNCTIFGPTIIGPGSYIGPGSEIRRSLVLGALTFSHFGYLGHSVVGRGVNLAAGFITAVRNLRKSHVYLKYENRIIDTGFDHFGAIIADDFYCRINTQVMPGRLLVEPIINPEVP